MEYRIERDTLGEIEVPIDALWGAATQRSINNFKIGVERDTMPDEIIRACAILKLGAARANRKILPDKMTEEKLAAITAACEKILSGELSEHFPLVVPLS